MSLLLLSLCLAAPAPFEKPTRTPQPIDDGQTFVISARSMKIPFTVQASALPTLKEMQLHYSADNGKTWHLANKALPDQEHFIFTAPADGLYLIKLRIVKKDGSLEPKEDLTKGLPELKIRVSTRR